MKRITTLINSQLKLCFSMLLMLSLVGYTQAQNYTYSASYFSDAGNPGGINTEADAPGLGTWNDVVIGPQAANIWSSVIFLPFPFDFYGDTKSVCYASQNGVVAFGNSFATPAPATVPGPNFNLPSVNFPDTAVGFWDEFTATPSTGSGDNIRTNTFGTAPNRQFWIKWYSFEMGNPTNTFSYFAIVLEETTNKIYIVDQYSSATPALTGTVGLQLTSSYGMQIGDSLVPFQGNGTATTDNDYWEFTPELLVDDNAGISALANPTLPLSVGLQNVDVTLENYGTNVLDSVMIEWTVDGVSQTGLNYTTPVPALGSVPVLNIGTYNFPSGFSTVKAWTSMPNGVADADVSNDTIEVELCTALNGTFSVGATSPDFLTIADAVDALNNCGVSGPVVLNVEPGTYTGGYILNDIIGTSATNTITFNGGNAAILDHDGTDIEAVWSFQGADYVTIKNFTINHSSTTDAWGVHIQNQSNHNTIDSCIFNMYANTGVFDVASIVASGSLTDDFIEGDHGDYNTFSNNQFNGGEYGIHLEGSSPTISSVDDWMSGIQILNNVFDNVDDYNIYVDNLDSLTIHGNTIANSQSVGSDGIYLLDVQNFIITANNISANDYGIYIADGNFDGPTIVPSLSLIANNMVDAPTDYALYLDDVNDVNVYHNTLRGEPALYFNDNLRVDVRNNILTSNGDYCFESADDLGTNITTDYNMYWTPAGNSFFVKAGLTANIHPDLATWQTADATNNANSLELLPNFVSATDLHMELANGFNSGDNTAGITVDIDGDTRPLAPTAIVDMGADEWNPPGDDAGISSFDSPTSPLTPGLQNIEVSVRNFGGNSVDSVSIDWEINGAAQTGLLYNTPVAIGASNANVLLGNFNFPVGFTTVKAWTSMPNSTADTENSNDTLEISLCTALNGVYTVGGVGSDFADIHEAVSALNNCGVSGPTTLNVQPGTYTGGYVLNEITGASATNTITIDGGSSASTFLTHDGTGIEAVWSFQGADYITIKNMDITNTGTTDAWGVHLQLQSNYNTIDSCIFNMNSNAGLIDVASIVASGSLTDDLVEGDHGDYNIFSNNQFNGGEYGIHLEGASSTISAVDEWMSGIQILNNVFDNVDDYNIYGDNLDSLTIHGNTIANSQNIGSDGIYLFDVQNFTITSNNISANDYGIYVADGNFDGPTIVPSLSLIANNMVDAPTDYALYLDDVNDLNIYHNTLRGEPALYMNDNLRMDVRNNILTSNSDYCFESLDDLGTNITTDYNMYWTPATNSLFVKAGLTANIHPDLATWQTADPTNNINSIEAEPLFLSATDLHRLGAVGADQGDNTTGITVDIDGDARPLAPATIVDMGADEYNPNADDAAIISIFNNGGSCGDSSVTISVIVQNLGINAINSLPVTVIYAGGLVDTTTITLTTPIPFGAIDTFIVDTINTYAGGDYDVSGYVSLSGDSDSSNDTLGITTSSFIPFEPTSIDGAVCGSNSGYVYADSTFTSSFDWYDAPTGGNLVGNGPSFEVPSISTQNTYYVEYGAFSDTIETIYNVTNGCGGGNMFDIDATINTSVSGFCLNSDATGNFNVTVHYITGSSYLGNETNATAWTTLGTFSVLSAGTNNPSCFSLSTPINIPAGQTVAIYLEYDANYQSLTSTYTNAAGNVTLSTGAGLCSSFGGVNPGRTFSGSVIFDIAPCSAIRVPTMIPLTPFAELGPDTSSCDTSYTLSVDPANASFDILWSNGDTTLTTSVTSTGTYNVTITDTTGCMSTDTVTVTFGSPSLDTIPVTDCDMVMLAGNAVTTSGFVTDSLSNALGCDSIVVYNVTIFNSTLDTIDVSACNSATVAGTTLTASGFVSDSLNTVSGCDSVVVYNVTIFNSTSDTIPVSGCDMVTVAGSNITASGFVSDTLTNTNGCDSVLVYDVTILNSSSSNVTAGLCFGELYMLPDSSTVDTAGTYVVTLANSAGCDSIVTTIIDIFPLTNVSISGITPQVCDTAGLIDVDLIPLGGTLSGNGISGTTFDPAVAGLGFTSITYQVADSNGCDLTAIFDVEVIECIVGIRGISGIETINVYPNPYTNNLSLIFEDQSAEELNITLFDALGRVVISEQVQTVIGTNTVQLSIPNHAAGITFIQFERNGNTYQQSLIKK